MSDDIRVPTLPFAVTGVVVLFVATASFGIGWLPQPWLIPTEIYPSAARAKGAAISVVIWGFANFAVTFLSPILFNNFKYWIFVVFAITNLIAGVWTWVSFTQRKRLSSADGKARHTRQKQPTGRLRRTYNSSLMPRTTAPGKSARSTAENFVIYHGRRKRRLTTKRPRCYNDT